MMGLVQVWLTLAVLIAVAAAGGQEPRDCEALRPSNTLSSTSEQSDESFPYHVTCQRIKHGNIAMSISGGKSFEGLIAQVRNSAGKAVGSVKKWPENVYKEVCKSRAVAHKDTRSKNKAKFVIKLSKAERKRTATSELNCVFSVVKSEKVYWLRHSVKVAGKGPIRRSSALAFKNSGDRKRRSVTKGSKKGAKKSAHHAMKMRRPQMRRRRNDPRRRRQRNKHLVRASARLAYMKGSMKHPRNGRISKHKKLPEPYAKLDKNPKRSRAPPRLKNH